MRSIDFDSEYDPQQLEQQLQAAFGDDYYNEEADLGPDGKPIKPGFDDDDEADDEQFFAASEGEGESEQPAARQQQEAVAAPVDDIAARTTGDAGVVLSNRQVRACGIWDCRRHILLLLLLLFAL